MSEPSGSRLIVRLDDQEWTVPVPAGGLTIGRSPESGLPLTRPQVSRYHARLTLSAQGPLLTDLDSLQGTFVGDEKLLPNQERLIAPGLPFSIGPYVLVYMAAAMPDPAPDDLPPPEPPVAEAPPPAPPAPPPVEPSPLRATPARAAPLDRDTFLPAPDQASRYQLLLPMIFHPDDLYKNDFLRRYLLLFEAIWEPLEARQDHVELYFDPHACPETFISWLASWFGLTINPYWPEQRRRAVLGEIFELYRWRGTNQGLTRMIELCLGLTPEIVDGEAPFTFRVNLRLPPDYVLDRPFLEQLIETHKPAHVGYTLTVT